MLQDQKIGHYMHIPPRATFFSQIFGCTLGVPINYAVIRWILNTKSEYLTGEMTDPSHQWTGQTIVSTLSLSVQYVLVVSRAFSLFLPNTSNNHSHRAPNASSKNPPSSPSPTVSFSVPSFLLSCSYCTANSPNPSSSSTSGTPLSSSRPARPSMAISPLAISRESLVGRSSCTGRSAINTLYGRGTTICSLLRLTRGLI